MRREHEEAINKAQQELMDGTVSHIEEMYVDIKFQLGPVKENGTNGTTIEHVIDILIDRLLGFQDGPYACADNARAIGHLQMAKADLMARTEDRKARGVEGTNKV